MSHRPFNDEGMEVGDCDGLLLCVLLRFALNSLNGDGNHEDDGDYCNDDDYVVICVVRNAHEN
jgi:hypothetical protein